MLFDLPTLEGASDEIFITHKYISRYYINVPILPRLVRLFKFHITTVSLISAVDTKYHFRVTKYEEASTYINA